MACFKDLHAVLGRYLVCIGPHDGLGALTRKRSRRLAWENLLSDLDQNNRTPESIMTVLEDVDRKFIPEHMAYEKHAGKGQDLRRYPRREMIQPGIEFTYEANAALGTPISIGATADGMRRIVPILEGSVAGPLIRGEIIGGGADWQLTRPDGVTVLDATYVLKTEDGVIIQIRNRGLRHGPAEVMAALAEGEPTDPSSYYFRTVPEFIAPVGSYEWLNRSIFICTGARYLRSIQLWVWRVI